MSDRMGKNWTDESCDDRAENERILQCGNDDDCNKNCKQCVVADKQIMELMSVVNRKYWKVL